MATLAESADSALLGLYQSILQFTSGTFAPLDRAERKNYSVLRVERLVELEDYPCCDDRKINRDWPKENSIPVARGRRGERSSTGLLIHSAAMD